MASWTAHVDYSKYSFHYGEQAPRRDAVVERWCPVTRKITDPGPPGLLDAVESPGTVITPGRSRDLTPGAPSDPSHLPPAYRGTRKPDPTRPETPRGRPHRSGTALVVNQDGAGTAGAGLSVDASSLASRTQKSMSPPPGIPPPAPADAFSGLSATTASVVRNSAAMDAAFCSADRVTLAGSMIPALIRSLYSPVAASRPSPAGRPLTFSATTP